MSKKTKGAATPAAIPKLEIELMMCGEAGSGKTTFVSCYMQGPGVAAAPNAQGFHIKNIDAPDRKICVKTWDSSGEERFRHLTTAAYKRSEGYMVVFDLNDEETFSRVVDWGDEIKRYCASENKVVFVVGNKTDLERVVTREQAEQAAAQIGASYFEACALNGTNVNEIFNDLLTRVVAGKDAADKAKKPSGGVSGLQKSTTTTGKGGKAKGGKKDGGGCNLL
ncbi:Ras family protein [Pelomyxa schiedti]|nr:Ras family protein [Pelomyxa schiedti]